MFTQNKKKSQRACDLLLKKKFFILTLFLKLKQEVEVCYALHLLKRRSSSSSTKLAWSPTL